MDQFIQRFARLIIGVLCGFDRLVFRGTLLPLIIENGMYQFLCRSRVRLLDFKKYVEKTSELVTAAALHEAKGQGRPVRPLQSSRIDKEAFARQLLEEHPIDQGLICAFSTVEPCMSFEYHRAQDPAERGLKLRPRKCKHIYHYYRHPEFGFCSARIQTWFPFSIQICLNGREWLATALAREKLAFRRDDNCVFWAKSLERAQGLLDRQLTLRWPNVLEAMARRLNPEHDRVFELSPMTYYWSVYQSEWATDVLFKTPAALAQLYPALVRHATTHFQSPDVMRFLGEIVSSFKNRPEGVRVKHWVKGNSVKMYDKAGSVLRVETTIGEPKEFKVFRPSSKGPSNRCARRPLRKGVVDLYRRAKVSQKVNSRYLAALATVDDTTPLREILDSVSKRARYRGHPARALRIGDPADISLLRAIARGEFLVGGFRNRDIRRLLHPAKAAPESAELRRQSARVTRLFRLLRAHGIIAKIPQSHRYRLTKRGLLLTATITALRDLPLRQVLKTPA